MLSKREVIDLDIDIELYEKLCLAAKEEGILPEDYIAFIIKEYERMVWEDEELV